MSGSYRDWQQVFVEVAGAKYPVATKPGVPAHANIDTASILLGQHVRIAKDDTIVYMNSGNGLAPAVGAITGRAKRIISTDRNIVSVQAARRTIKANTGAVVEVIAGHGAAGIDASVIADNVAIRIPHEKLALVQLLWRRFQNSKDWRHLLHLRREQRGNQIGDETSRARIRKFQAARVRKRVPNRLGRERVGNSCGRRGVREPISRQGHVS
jgi:16S RNA G1207 methylase RsmC